jgi:5-formyltetrahydrofolate cyclo-ligase
MTKRELRKIFLAKRKSLSDAERNERSRQIADRFFARFDLENVRVLHVFLTIEQQMEIETAYIIERLWNDFPHVKTVVPRVNAQTMRLEHLNYTADTKLVKNKWNIFEPSGNELVEIEKIDLVLVPLLCFDERGFRVGYGKGFYDGFLVNCRRDCLKIGLSYFAPIRAISDTHEFDVKLDFCVTPETIFDCER